MKKTKWYQAKVVSGKKRGRKIGFPTLNLDNPKILSSYPPGVYLAKIKIEGKVYSGLLYCGPRLVFGEKKRTLEIFVFNFRKKIYGEKIFFQLGPILRKPKKFSDLKTLASQIRKDCQKAQKKLK